MRIGIGITTHNRYETFATTYAKIKLYCISTLVYEFKIVVVDDASDKPVKEANYRFEKNVGIAKAKNKCFELLDDCEHIFLFDDDCYPITEGWYLPYIESEEPHICYIFTDFINDKTVGDSVKLYHDSKIVAYSHPRGCMLYFDHKCLEAVGGMDENYRKWGYEHVDLSNRIFNAGLTTFRYMDLPNSNKLIYSCDEHIAVVTTTPVAARINDIIELKPYFTLSFKSTKFCDYKIEDGEYAEISNGIVLTSYFTGFNDTQRNKTWSPNINDIKKLIDSCTYNLVDIVVLNNCFDSYDFQNVTYKRVEATLNPYFQRWISQYQYLRDHPEIDYVWCVDATDTELLKDPFKKQVKGKLYLGYEPKFVASEWMLGNFKQNCYTSMFSTYGGKTLLNCGVIGGSREDVMALMHDMLGFYSDHAGNVGPFEMGMFNYVVWNNWRDKIIYGPAVTTIFKGFENNNVKAIWRHK